MIIFDLRCGVMNRSTFLLFWSLLRRIHRLTLPEMGIFLPSAYLKLGSSHCGSLSTFHPLVAASCSSRMLYLDPVSRVILSWELVFWPWLSSAILVALIRDSASEKESS